MLDKLEALLEWGGTKKDIAFLIISTISLVASFAAGGSLPVDPAWIAIVLCGLPIICEAIIGLVTAFDIKADVLVSLALIASVIIGEYFAAGEVAVIMQLGGLLEELTVARARSGIERLVEMTPRTARIIGADGQEQVVPAEQVAQGDMLRVLPGETIPVDGVVTSGATSIDQSVMTGESLPVDKGPGDDVTSGTVNRFGTFEMRATKVGEDSSIARMVRLVESADAGKAKIVRLADRWATWVVVTALVAAAITWAVTGEIIRAVTILVVFCPCSLVLATPTAIMAAIGNVTKFGVLVREGDALERLSKVSRVMFDKTGTLTYGRLQVAAVEDATARMLGSLGHTGCCGEHDHAAMMDKRLETADKVLFGRIAAAESLSEHPLGRAVADSYRRRYGEIPYTAEDFTMVPGLGIKAKVDGTTVAVGSARLMAELDVLGLDESFGSQYAKQGCTVSYIAVGGIFAGMVALEDAMRETAPTVVSGISQLGVSTIMATGDSQEAADAIAARAGVDEVRAECLPQDKLACIEDYESQDVRICMVGDGVNDAPALRRSFVGIAMGGVGSDIAVDAADMVLVGDDIAALPHVIGLSKHMMRVIKANLTFSMTLNFVAIVLAMIAVLDPVSGALVHNCGSVMVIVNSSFLLRWGTSPKAE